MYSNFHSKSLLWGTLYREPAPAFSHSAFVLGHRFIPERGADFFPPWCNSSVSLSVFPMAVVLRWWFVSLAVPLPSLVFFWKPQEKLCFHPDSREEMVEEYQQGICFILHYSFQTKAWNIIWPQLESHQKTHETYNDQWKKKVLWSRLTTD